MACWGQEAELCLSLSWRRYWAQRLTRGTCMQRALAVTLPVTALSAWRYGAAGSLDVTGFLRLLLPATVGGAVGGWLLDRMDTQLTKKIFAAVVIFSGLSMLFRR